MAYQLATNVQTLHNIKVGQDVEKIVLQTRPKDSHGGCKSGASEQNGSYMNSDDQKKFDHQLLDTTFHHQCNMHNCIYTHSSCVKLDLFCKQPLL